MAGAMQDRVARWVVVLVERGEITASVSSFTPIRSCTALSDAAGHRSQDRAVGVGLRWPAWVAASLPLTTAKVAGPDRLLPDNRGSRMTAVLAIGAAQDYRTEPQGRGMGWTPPDGICVPR